MSIINIEVITAHDPAKFKKMVNAFLDKNEEMVFLDKTVYGVTQVGQLILREEEGLTPVVLNNTKYNAIFQVEGRIREWKK